MNDPTHSDTQSPDSVSAETHGKSALKRQLVLILILAIMLGALYWDRKVARPNSQAKQKELEELATERLTSSKPQLSQEEVATALGRGPVATRDLDGFIIEKFSWRGGLSWRTYDINVQYTKTRDGGGHYHASFYNQEPEDALLATIGSPATEGPAPTPEDLQGGPPLDVPDPANSANPNGGPPLDGADPANRKKGRDGAKRKGRPPADDPEPADPPADAPAP